MRIYIAHSNDLDYTNEIYNPLKNEKRLNKHTLLLPHEKIRGTNNDREFYSTIDLFIAECTLPGTGLGIELGWVYDDNIPIYCLYKKGNKLSSSLKAVTNNFLEYDSKEEFVEKIIQIVERYKL